MITPFAHWEQQYRAHHNGSDERTDTHEPTSTFRSLDVCGRRRRVEQIRSDIDWWVRRRLHDCREARTNATQQVIDH